MFFLIAWKITIVSEVINSVPVNNYVVIYRLHRTDFGVFVFDVVDVDETPARDQFLPMNNFFNLSFSPFDSWHLTNFIMTTRSQMRPHAWQPLTGFCITYTALLMKTWRVSLTYRVKSAHKVKLTDKQLLQWMVPILLVMGIYLGTWTAAEPPTATEVI